MLDKKHPEINVTFVKAGDRIMVSGLWRIVARVEKTTTGDVSFFFDHGDYMSSVTYPPIASVVVMS